MSSLYLIQLTSFPTLKWISNRLLYILNARTAVGNERRIIKSWHTLRHLKNILTLSDLANTQHASWESATICRQTCQPNKSLEESHGQIKMSFYLLKFVKMCEWSHAISLILHSQGGYSKAELWRFIVLDNGDTSTSTFISCTILF